MHAIILGLAAAIALAGCVASGHPPRQPDPPIAATPKRLVFLIFFQERGAELTADGPSAIAETVNAVRAGKRVRVLPVANCEGHSHAYCNQWNERRAAIVKAEVIRLGVVESMIAVVRWSFDDSMDPVPDDHPVVIEIMK